MEKLFGVPVNQLLVMLMVLWAVESMVMGVVAVRNRVMLKMAVRNIPRRVAQSMLIVVGLMLATTLFSASFVTGDTLSHSIRVLAVDQLGEVDVVVEAEYKELSGRPTYFDNAYLETVRDGLSSVPEVDGVAPKAHEVVPVLAPSTRLSEPRVHILGLAEEWMSGFDRLVDKEGNSLSLSALGLGQAYLSEEVAHKLEVSSGDTLQVFLGTEPSTIEVDGVYEKGAKTVHGQPSIVIPLERLQALTNNEGRITSILISTRGDTVESAKNTSAVLSGLEPLLEGSGLEARPVKQDALEEAEEVGTVFSTIFLVFGQFSVAAGILLIFLIFVMLAAERKRELGIARAVGMFTFEGPSTPSWPRPA